MLAEISCILVGIPVGYALRQRPRIVGTAHGMASGIIYALLFLLGLSLGSNDHLLAKLGELGVQGICIGIACSLGSVVVTALVARYFFRLPDKTSTGNI